MFVPHVYAPLDYVVVFVQLETRDLSVILQEVKAKRKQYKHTNV